MRRSALLGAGLVGALVLTGCSADNAQAEISVSGAYMPQPVSDSMAAGFLTIANEGGTDAELTSVTSDIAGDVTLHETVDSAMQEMKTVDLPADGKVVFKSGGNHLMFEKLKKRPQEGDTVSVVLHFADADPVTVEMPVKSPTYTPASGH
ncbi:copper chaperone PCu(A)C [Streptomyces sp. NPDC050803]|uniref:copper chaperone PCu(A)C n=1 Tax=unclassified Streptomyces TaxID=2593676 RepID=UPI0034175FFD